MCDALDVPNTPPIPESPIPESGILDADTSLAFQQRNHYETNTMEKQESARVIPPSRQQVAEEIRKSYLREN